MTPSGAGPARPGPPSAGAWPPRPGVPRPPRRPRHGLVLGLGVGLVAVVVAIVVIATVLTSGQGRLTEVWSVPKPDRMGDAATLMAYPTVDGKTFVRVSAYGAVGYDLATGRTRWRLVPPKAETVCAATHGAPGGVGALVYDEGTGCTKALAFDASTGHRLWTSTLAGDHPGSAALALAGGRVYLTNTQRIVRYDARPGPHGTGAAAPVTVRPSAADCRFAGVAATTARVVTIETCGRTPRALVGLDPKTLRTAFRTPLRAEVDQEMHVVSVRPLVLHATNALDNGELRFFDDAGRQTKVFSSRQHRGTLLFGTPSGGRDDNVSFPFRVVGDTLVAQLDYGSWADKHRIAGIDVRRGRWAWTSSVRAGDGLIMATGGDRGKVAVFAEGGFTPRIRKERPHVLEVDPADGEVAKGDELKVGDNSPEFYGSSVFVVGHRMMIVRNTTMNDAPIITAYGQK